MEESCFKLYLILKLRTVAFLDFNKSIVMSGHDHKRITLRSMSTTELMAYNHKVIKYNNNNNKSRTYNIKINFLKH